MADTHSEVEALFKTSPTCSHGNYCEADVRRIATLAVEKEREECAKVADAAQLTCTDYCTNAAAAIRRRGKGENP